MENKSKVNYKDKCIYLEQCIAELTDNFAEVLAEKELVIANNSEYLDELEKDLEAICTAFKLIEKYKYYGGKRKDLYKRVNMANINFDIPSDTTVSERALATMR